MSKVHVTPHYASGGVTLTVGSSAVTLSPAELAALLEEACNFCDLYTLSVVIACRPGEWDKLRELTKRHKLTMPELVRARVFGELDEYQAGLLERETQIATGIDRRHYDWLLWLQQQLRDVYVGDDVAFVKQKAEEYKQSTGYDPFAYDPDPLKLGSGG